MDEAVSQHYERGFESGRLISGGLPSLEMARTLELLERFLPGPPADILDVGGGPGVYAAILARQGYRVELIDPSLCMWSRRQQRQLCSRNHRLEPGLEMRALWRRTMRRLTRSCCSGRSTT